MGGAVDLHTHTTASDGTLPPRELVRLAVKHGVRVLAITDHDSTDGLPDALDEAAQHPPLTVVPGLEINCDVEGAEIHVLGYFIDWQADWFQDFLREQRAERIGRAHKIASRLTELGMPMTAEEIFAIAGEAAVGRPHVAQAMIARGYVKSVREAFDKYLKAGGPANVPRRRLPPVGAVEVIRKAGGVPVLAHPGRSDRDDIIPELVNAGLLGLEVFYPEHSTADTQKYSVLCHDFSLMATGGSDYHGPRAGLHRQPGIPVVRMAVWDALVERARQLGCPTSH